MANAEASPAEIQKRLGGMDYPASKKELINHAKNGGGENDDVMKVLNKLPDKKYNSPVDVTKEVGNIE